MKPGRCQRCLLPHEFCLCAHIPQVPTRTHVVILRHFKEQVRSSNTGGLAHHALPNSQLFPYGDRDAVLTRELVEGGWLLFPGNEDTPSLPIEALPELPAKLIVLDGNWNQCRRMARRVDKLVKLPRLQLPPPPERLRMRAPPQGGLATIEAIAAALQLLEGRGRELDALFERHVQVMLRMRGRMGGAKWQDGPGAG